MHYRTGTGASQGLETLNLQSVMSPEKKPVFDFNWIGSCVFQVTNVLVEFTFGQLDIPPRVAFQHQVTDGACLRVVFHLCVEKAEKVHDRTSLHVNTTNYVEVMLIPGV